jgi:hypothetical protein
MCSPRPAPPWKRSGDRPTAKPEGLQGAILATRKTRKRSPRSAGAPFRGFCGSLAGPISGGGAASRLDRRPRGPVRKKRGKIEGHFQSASGDTIVNAKVSLRIGLGDYSHRGGHLNDQLNFYAGYSLALTEQILYWNMFRLDLI